MPQLSFFPPLPFLTARSLIREREKNAEDAEVDGWPRTRFCLRICFVFVFADGRWRDRILKKSASEKCLRLYENEPGTRYRDLRSRKTGPKPLWTYRSSSSTVARTCRCKEKNSHPFNQRRQEGHLRFFDSAMLRSGFKAEHPTVRPSRLSTRRVFLQKSG